MSRRSFALGALACSALAACKDVPLLPRWEADWVLPLPTQSINLPNEWGGTTVPPNTSFNISFPEQQQTLDETFATFDLGETLRPGSRIVLTIGKAASTALGISDTIFVGESAAALTATNTRTIRLGINLQTGDTESSDTLAITDQNLQMIQAVARAGGALWIKTSGTATSGPAGYTFTGGEVLTARVQLIARVAMSR